MRAQTFRNLFVLVGVISGAFSAQHAPSASSPQDRFPDVANARSPEFLQVATTASAASTSVNGNYAVPINFEPNQGQTDPQVRFLARGKGYRVFLTATDAIVSLHAVRGDRQPLLLRIQPIGANPAPRLVAESALPGTVNYIRGADSKTSITGIPTYGCVRYQDAYPGVDLVYHGDGRQLEYDFVVDAGADPEQIQLRFKGASKLTVNAAGELVLHTAAGELPQPRPVVYQEIDGVRRTIAGSYLLKGRDQVGFGIGDYDRSRPLTIDPLLAYSTYFGGSGDEIGWDIAVDAAGNAHIVGTRPSVRFPDSVDDDAFVAKFNADGALLWLTDVGENCDDQGRGVALDSSGNVYITGQLGNCYPFPELQPGAFVVKLTAAGAQGFVFPFSDYWYGGSDLGQAIAVDSTGRTYVAGITSSHEFPVTPGSFQQTFAGGIGDGFVVKVNAAGTALLYGTYLGGTAYESLNDLALDSGRNVYVTGSTNSIDFPVTAGAFQPTNRSWHPGNRDGFVTKLNASGSALLYSTYLGGSDDDIANGIAVDAAGNAYVAGVIESIDFPTTMGSFQPTPLGDRWCYYTYCTDAFVTKLNASGTALVYSTFLGGDIFDAASGIAIDSAGSAYVTGNTVSFTFPVVDAFQPNGAGQGDAFVTKLNAAGSALIYSSYLGGSSAGDVSLEGEDAGIRIAADSGGGSAYIIGLTRSPDFPLVNAHQPVFGGGKCGVSGYRCSDAFVAKVGVGCTFGITPTSQAVPAGGGTGTVSVTASATTCSRTATSAAGWITITSGATGTGSGPVGYSVAANTGTVPRASTMTIAGQTFTVNQAAPSALSVAVTSPNGGEKVFSGTPSTIAWTAAGATAFDVEVSADNGATYSPIAGCVGLPGSARGCGWAVPGPLTSTGRIRVTARDAVGSLADISNAAFSIVSGVPSVTVTFPNGAVNVGIGSTQTIKWNHNLGTGSFVKIELSRDGGLTFPQTLVAAHKNTAASSGTYNWLVTGPAMATAQARIRVSSISGPATDTSNASFTIAPVFITSAGPATGSSWGFATTQIQAWNTNLGALDRVNVELSTTGIGGGYSTMSGGANIVATAKQASVVVPSTASTTSRVRVVWANPPAGFAATGNNPGNSTSSQPSSTSSRRTPERYGRLTWPSRSTGRAISVCWRR
jgi:Beta-propeller repeat